MRKTERAGNAPRAIQLISYTTRLNLLVGFRRPKTKTGHWGKAGGVAYARNILLFENCVVPVFPSLLPITENVN